MEAVHAKKPAFDVVSYAPLHPKAWLDAVDTHVNHNTLTVDQWKGLRDALSDLFLSYDRTNHALFETFSALVDELTDSIDVQHLCSALNQISAADTFPDLTMIRYGNYLRVMILEPVSSFSELTPQALKKLEIACMLVSEDMGFTKEQAEHAQAVIREINDASDGQLGRLQAAAVTLHTDFNYSGYGPTQARKMGNWLFGW